MTKDRNLSIAFIKMIFTAMCWGGTFIAVRAIADEVSAPFVGFMRYLIASICLILVFEFKKNSIFRQKLSLRDFFELFILALFGMFAYNMFFVVGLEIVTASRASLIIANNPIIIAIGAVVFFKEKLNKVQVLGILISFLGAITVLTNGNYIEILNGISYGDLIIFGCVMSWFIFSIVGKIVLRRLRPLFAVTWACIIATFIFLPFAFKDLYQDLTSMSLIIFLAVTYLGIFGTAIGFVYFYEVMNIIGAVRTGIFISFVPVFATFFSIIILGETINLAFIIAGILTLTGVYLVNKK